MYVIENIVNCLCKSRSFSETISDRYRTETFQVYMYI